MKLFFPCLCAALTFGPGLALWATKGRRFANDVEAWLREVTP